MKKRYETVGNTKKMLSCSATEVSESVEPFVDSNRRLEDYAGCDDLWLVAGDNTLTLVFNVLLGGLHNVLSYDPCSRDIQNCCSEINAIIGTDLEEVYESIVVKMGENQYLLNIGINLLQGPGIPLSQKLCEDLIDAFYPVIKRFVDEHIVDNKVGIYSVFADGHGTSVGLLGLVNHLEKDGYVCCGVGTSYHSSSYSLKLAKEWQGFKYIDCGDLPGDEMFSLLHDELVAKMGNGTVRQ